MKFKNLNESIYDDIYDKLTDFIYDELESALDNIAILAVSEVAGYDADWCAEGVTQFGLEGNKRLKQAAESYAEELMANAPDTNPED